MAYISIGSNIDPEHNIHSAIRMLKSHFSKLRLSSVYRNPAVGFEGEDFYNMVVEFDSSLTIEQMNALLDDIECQHGRSLHHAKFSSRPLDLDLLLYGDQVQVEDGRQKLPRGEILQYAFVLGPLAELIPSTCYPITGETYGQLWQSFKGENKLQKVEFNFD